MKKNKIVYLRNPRVGSSAFISMLEGFHSDGYIDVYSGTHSPFNQVQEEVLKNKGKQFWDNSIKVVSVRNPWDQHVSFFLKTRKITQKTNDLNSIAKKFKTLPGREQEALINNFREVVSQQLKYIRGEVSDVYDAASIHGLKKPGKDQNAVRNSLARLYKIDQIYIHEGKSLADCCIRMEESFLENDLKQFIKKINVSMDSPRVQQYIAGAGRINYNNQEHYNYQEFYDSNTEQAVKEIRKLEIDLHEYKFK